MKILLFFVAYLSLNSYANVSSGEAISAVDINNKTFTIGDIKTSILTITQFQTLHGSCWVQLNQGTDNSNIDISGSDLSSLIGNTTLKSSTGRVLRSAGGNANSVVGTTQEDATAVNGLSVGNTNPIPSTYSYIWTRTSGNWGTHEDETHTDSTNKRFDAMSIGEFNHSHSLSGDNETRMQNLTVNTFIKINHNCN